MTQHIIITGPESSGKTSLAQSLAIKLNCECIPEYARQYLANIDHPYNAGDIKEMAKKTALAFERKKSTSAIFDTGFLVLKVWYEEKFGLAPKVIDQGLGNMYSQLYILCTPDMPWSRDELRENPNDRDRLFKIYLGHLKKLNKNYRIVNGSAQNRLDQATNFITSKAKDIRK